MPYPPIEPYRWGYLERPSGHTLYFEESGNPQGVPVVVLHGGPGSGSRPGHRRWFDPAAYRVVLWDQRGAGRSRPAGELAGNDTARLVEDTEALRAHLGLERWLVFGGSWGGTLALRYVAAHRERTLGLVVRGTLAGRRIDRDWFFGRHGVARLLPWGYHRFLDALPNDLRAEPLRGYRMCLSPDADEHSRRRAAAAWLAWEECVSGAARPPPAPGPAGDCATGRARIACHFAINDFFLDPEAGALPPHGALDGLPGTIVHGARDLVCPVDQAMAIHERWPGARLDIVEGAGHLEGEAGIAAALIAATDRLRDRLLSSGP